jgi:hypothetical protein
MKWASHLLMLFAIITIVAHNSTAHHHIEIKSSSPHHHHEQHEENQHNLFSFVQLDEDFLPVQYNQFPVALPVFCLPASNIGIKMKVEKQDYKSHFAYYREEFPPPINRSSNLFSRPPPNC